MSERCRSGLAWCGGGHRCHPALGVHRSDPWAVRTRYGALVATRVLEQGRGRLEVRVVVDLPDGPSAQGLARLLLVVVDLAVRDALAGRLARARAAYERVRRA